MAKTDKDDYYSTSLDQCPKCGGHDVKPTETTTSNNVKIVSVYCRHCGTETRRRMLNA